MRNCTQKKFNHKIYTCIYYFECFICLLISLIVLLCNYKIYNYLTYISFIFLLNYLINVILLVVYNLYLSLHNFIIQYTLLLIICNIYVYNNHIFWILHFFIIFSSITFITIYNNTHLSIAYFVISNLNLLIYKILYYVTYNCSIEFIYYDVILFVMCISMFYQFFELYKKLACKNYQNKTLLHINKHFLSCVSHEMRTPLTTIVGYIDIINTSNLTYNDSAHIEIIKSASNILLFQISNIICYNKLMIAPIIETTNNVFNILHIIENITVYIVVKM